MANPKFICCSDITKFDPTDINNAVNKAYDVFVDGPLCKMESILDEIFNTTVGHNDPNSTSCSNFEKACGSCNSLIGWLNTKQYERPSSYRAGIGGAMNACCSFMSTEGNTGNKGYQGGTGSFNADNVRNNFCGTDGKIYIPTGKLSTACQELVEYGFPQQKLYERSTGFNETNGTCKNYALDDFDKYLEVFRDGGKAASRALINIEKLECEEQPDGSLIVYAEVYGHIPGFIASKGVDFLTMGFVVDAYKKFREFFLNQAKAIKNDLKNTTIGPINDVTREACLAKVAQMMCGSYDNGGHPPIAGRRFDLAVLPDGSNAAYMLRKANACSAAARRADVFVKTDHNPGGWVMPNVEDICKRVKNKIICNNTLTGHNCAGRGVGQVNQDCYNKDIGQGDCLPNDGTDANRIPGCANDGDDCANGRVDSTLIYIKKPGETNVEARERAFINLRGAHPGCNQQKNGQDCIQYANNPTCEPYDPKKLIPTTPSGKPMWPGHRPTQKDLYDQTVGSVGDATELGKKQNTMNRFNESNGWQSPKRTNKFKKNADGVWEKQINFEKNDGTFLESNFQHTLPSMGEPYKMMKMMFDTSHTGGAMENDATTMFVRDLLIADYLATGIKKWEGDSPLDGLYLDEGAPAFIELFNNDGTYVSKDGQTKKMGFSGPEIDDAYVVGHAEEVMDIMQHAVGNSMDGMGVATGGGGYHPNCDPAVIEAIENSDMEYDHYHPNERGTHGGDRLFRAMQNPKTSYSDNSPGGIFSDPNFFTENVMKPMMAEFDSNGVLTDADRKMIPALNKNLNGSEIMANFAGNAKGMLDEMKFVNEENTNFQQDIDDELGNTDDADDGTQICTEDYAYCVANSTPKRSRGGRGNGVVPTTSRTAAFHFKYEELVYKISKLGSDVFYCSENSAGGIFKDILNDCTAGDKANYAPAAGETPPVQKLVQPFDPCYANNNVQMPKQTNPCWVDINADGVDGGALQQRIVCMGAIAHLLKQMQEAIPAYDLPPYTADEWLIGDLQDMNVMDDGQQKTIELIKFSKEERLMPVEQMQDKIKEAIAEKVYNLTVAQLAQMASTKSVMEGAVPGCDR